MRYLGLGLGTSTSASLDIYAKTEFDRFQTTYQRYAKKLRYYNAGRINLPIFAASIITMASLAIFLFGHLHKITNFMLVTGFTFVTMASAYTAMQVSIENKLRPMVNHGISRGFFMPINGNLGHALALLGLVKMHPKREPQLHPIDDSLEWRAQGKKNKLSHKAKRYVGLAPPANISTDGSCGAYHEFNANYHHYARKLRLFIHIESYLPIITTFTLMMLSFAASESKESKAMGINFATSMIGSVSACILSWSYIFKRSVERTLRELVSKGTSAKYFGPLDNIPATALAILGFNTSREARSAKIRPDMVVGTDSAWHDPANESELSAPASWRSLSCDVNV